jgi:serine/threonine-protein kinase
MTDVDDQADLAGSAEMLGRRLGRYTCVQRLGSGGMAVLYLARRTGAKGFTKLFALKRIKPQYASDPSFTRMFMREAKLCASLDHPNIAQVIDFGQDGQEHFLVMEYVHGPDLRRLLRHSPAGRLPLPCAIAILTRVCAALHYAHEKTDADGVPLGLVHRDVSPTNVLLSVDGAVKLTDFGIAKAFGGRASGTSSGMLVGKPGYMSPEQVRTQPLDRRSDVFSLGILLYEITTGHRCFFGDNVFAILNATQKAAIVAPSRRDPAYPAALERIVVRALQADPADRFASARELQVALEELALDQRMRTSDAVLCEYIAGLQLGLLDPGSIVDLPDPSDAEVHESGGTAFMLSGGTPLPPSLPDAAPGPRVPRLAIGIGAGLLGALVAAVVMSGGEDAEPSEPSAAIDVPANEVAESKRPPPEPTPKTEAPPVEKPEPTPSAAPPPPEEEPTLAARPRKSKRARKPKRSGSTRTAPTDLDAIVPPSRRNK